MKREEIDVNGKRKKKLEGRKERSINKKKKKKIEEEKK